LVNIALFVAIGAPVRFLKEPSGWSLAALSDIVLELELDVFKAAGFPGPHQNTFPALLSKSEYEGIGFQPVSRRGKKA
jgi:hypothetical protein